MSTTWPSWRLILDDVSRDGAWNMAVDEMLLRRMLRDPGRAPVLRLYGWSPAAVSLGRSQPAAGSHDPRVLRDEGLDLVRRPTGGSAVLHEHERTYGLVGPLVGEFAGGVTDTYARIARALVRALKSLGLEAFAVDPGGPVPSPSKAIDPVCFGRTANQEIAVGGRKLIGSAQRRGRSAFLQHGSLPLRLAPERLAHVLGVPLDPRWNFTDLERESAGSVAPSELDQALLNAFESEFDVEIRPSSLDDGELVEAEQLRCFKYYSTSWTYDGRIGEREGNLAPLPLT